MDIAQVLLLSLHAMVPLALTALGEIVAERSGVVNIGLEGILLLSAFFAVLGAEALGSPWAGLLVGLLAGALIGLVHGLLSVHLRGDQIISGVGINVFALGFVAFGIPAVWGVAGYHQVADAARVPDLPTPWGGLSPLVPVVFALAGLIYLLLRRTPLGRWIDAVGENPEAADVAGLPVLRVRLLAVIFGAALGGLAGAYLSLDWTHTITKELPAGRGFIALATVVFSKLNPLLALLGGFLFGLFDTLGEWISSLPAVGKFVPHQFVRMIPYIATLVVVAGVIGRARFPKALGQPYARE